jgi:hypothetical protein
LDQAFWPFTIQKFVKGLNCNKAVGLNLQLSPSVSWTQSIFLQFDTSGTLNIPNITKTGRSRIKKEKLLRFEVRDGSAHPNAVTPAAAAKNRVCVWENYSVRGTFFQIPRARPLADFVRVNPRAEN